MKLNSIEFVKHIYSQSAISFRGIADITALYCINYIVKLSKSQDNSHNITDAYKGLFSLDIYKSKVKTFAIKKDKPL